MKDRKIIFTAITRLIGLKLKVVSQIELLVVENRLKRRVPK